METKTEEQGKIGTHIQRFDVIDSTNLELKRKYRELEHGMVCVAEYQTQGRGRMNRKWVSSRNAALMFSILLFPSQKPDKFATITPLVGLAVVETLKQFGIEAKLKWPNDVVIESKKCCGILCEGIFEEKNAIIVGIGINVTNEESDFDESFRNSATSLSEVSKRTIDKGELLDAFLNNFQVIYKIWDESGFFTFRKQIEKILAKNGEQILVIDGENKFWAVIQGLSSEGELIVKAEDGENLALQSGEISIRGVEKYI